MNAKGSHLIFKSMSITSKVPQKCRLIGEYERGHIPLHSVPVGLLPVFLGAHIFTFDFHSGEQIDPASTELLADAGCFRKVLLSWVGPSFAIELTVSHCMSKVPI